MTRPYDGDPCPGCGVPLVGLANKCWAPGCDWTAPLPSASKPKRQSPSEKQIQTAIKRALALHPVHVYDLSQPRASMQTPGLPDLYLVGYGHALWVEVKTPEGQQSEAQRLFEEVVGNTRGVGYAVWRSAEDAIQWCERMKREAA